MDNQLSFESATRPIDSYCVVESLDDEGNVIAEDVFKNTISVAGYTALASLMGSIDGATSLNYIKVATGGLEENASTTQDTDKALKSSGADSKLAQQITATGTRSVKRVLLWMKRVGSGAGTLSLSIQTDAAGLPSGTPITDGTATAVNFNTLGTTYDWIVFEFATPPSLNISTVYHLVLESSGYTYSAGVLEAVLGIDQSSPGYTGGELETYDGATWTTHSPAADACFRVAVVAINSYSDGTATTKSITSRSASSQVGFVQLRLIALFANADAVDYLTQAFLLAGATIVAYTTIGYRKSASRGVNVYWLIKVPTS